MEITEEVARASFERMHQGRDLKRNSHRGTYNPTLEALWKQHLKTIDWLTNPESVFRSDNNDDWNIDATLLPTCPFCKEIPKIAKRGGGAYRSRGDDKQTIRVPMEFNIACKTEGCTQPQTGFLPKKEAIRKWSERAP